MFLQKEFKKSFSLLRFLPVLMFISCGIVLGMDIDQSDEIISQEVQEFLDYVKSGKADKIQSYVEGRRVDLRSIQTRSDFNDAISLGVFALGEAVKADQNESVIRLLKYVDTEEGTVLIDGKHALGTVLVAAAYRGNIPLIKQLIDLGADIDGDELFTPLHAAVTKGHSLVVPLLIDNGANLEIRYDMDDNKSTALEIAASAGNSEIAKILLEHSAKIDLGEADNSSSDYDIRPAIVHAAIRYRGYSQSNDHLGVFKMLLNKGADVNASDSEECTALDIGVENNDSQLIKMLFELRGNDLSYSSKLEALVAAADKGNLQMIDLLRRHDADINGRYSIDRNGSTIQCSPLIFAANKGHRETVQYLLNRGAAPEGLQLSAQGLNLMKQYFPLFSRHMKATKDYLEENIEPRDLHSVVFGMLYGAKRGSLMGKRLQESRKGQEASKTE